MAHPHGRCPRPSFAELTPKSRVPPSGLATSLRHPGVCECRLLLRERRAPDRLDPEAKLCQDNNGPRGAVTLRGLAARHGSQEPTESIDGGNAISWAAGIAEHPLAKDSDMRLKVAVRPQDGGDGKQPLLGRYPWAKSSLTAILLFCPGIARTPPARSPRRPNLNGSVRRIRSARSP